MIRGFRSCFIITAILIATPQCQAAKKDILNFDHDPFAIDNKIRATAEISRKCLYGNKMLSTVSETVDDKMIKHLHRSERTSITSFASSRLFVQQWYFTASKNKELYNGNHYYRFLWKSRCFLLSASSPANLKEQLDKMKDSRWWNPTAYFLLIEDELNSFAEKCSNAYDFLFLAWNYGLLNSVFLCLEEDGTASIYTYNPYSDSVPQPWLKNREIKGLQGHPWSMFKWEKYAGRNHSCENIFFDKTTSLHGYPIMTNAFALNPFLYFNKNATGLEMYEGEDSWTMKDIWTVLNASIVDVPLSDESAVPGWVDAKGTVHGNLIDISSGKVDIGFNSLILQDIWKMTSIYPHSTMNVCFLTKDQGTVPWLIGLAMVFDWWTMLFAATTFFLSTVIFGYVEKRRYFSGFLNTLRVFVSTSFIRPPSSNGLRMILCFIFFVPIIFNSTIQGNIISLIRNPLNYANVDLLENLGPAGYHAEGLELFKVFIPPSEIRDQFVPTLNLDDCIKKSLENERVACFSYCYSIMVKVSYNKKLHRAEDESAYYQSRYIAKQDWPLTDRFNSVLQRIVESGLTGWYRSMSIYEKAASSDNDSSDDTARVIRLRELRYVFMALGIGWTCATLAFIGELIIGRSKIPKISKARVKSVVRSRLRGLKISRLVTRMKLKLPDLCNE